MWLFKKRSELSFKRREQRDNLLAIPWYGYLIYGTYLAHEYIGAPYWIAWLDATFIGIIVIGLVILSIRFVKFIFNDPLLKSKLKFYDT